MYKLLWDLRKGRNYSGLGQVAGHEEELRRLCGGFWVIENPRHLDKVLRDG